MSIYDLAQLNSAFAYLMINGMTARVFSFMGVLFMQVVTCALLYRFSMAIINKFIKYILLC